MGTDEGRLIIGGGVPGARLFPEDLVEFQCPDHLMAALAAKTNEYLRKMGGLSGAYSPDKGTLGVVEQEANVEALGRFFTAAQLARKDLGVRLWPDAATWARANGLGFRQSETGEIRVVQR